MMTTAATGNPHDVFSYTCVVQEQVHTIAATVDVIIMFMILVAISVTARRNKTSKMYEYQLVCIFIYEDDLLVNFRNNLLKSPPFF
jgi:hypothetical protein